MSKTENSDNTVYILDSFGLIFRAYYAMFNHPLTNNEGQNISAVVIFFRNLKSLISKYNPKYLAAAFDSKTKTFRHNQFAQYKSNRSKAPEDLLSQIPIIEEILKAWDIPILQKDGYEADDVIATVAKKCREQNMNCRILSGDKDLLQLVNETCWEMQPDKTNGGWMTLGPAEVNEQWGISPAQILDYLSLVGDTADNVPGVKGVGDKTAIKLLSQYQTLDGIYEHAGEIKGALGEKIRSDKDAAYLSKELITLVDDVPVDINFESFKTDSLNWAQAAQLLNQYGAVQIAKSFGSESSDEVNLSAQTKKSEPTKKIAPEMPQDPVFTEIKQNSGNYRACTKTIELDAFITELLSKKQKTVALDTETDSLDSIHTHLVGFSLCTEKGSGIYIPVLADSPDLFAPAGISLEDSIAQISRLFADKDVTLVMHNAKFDLEVLHCNGLTQKMECHLFDTMIAAWLLNPAEDGKNPYSLETLGERKLGLKGIEYSDIVPKGKTFADVPLEQAVPYCAEDSDFTFQLYEIFAAKLKEEGLENLYYNMEMKVLPILVSMEEEGIHLDKEALKTYGQELEGKIQQMEKEIFALAGHEFNISSPKQLQTVLFEEQGLNPGKKTKTGYSTDTAVLEELSYSSLNPLPQAILDYRSVTKLNSTYVQALPKDADENSKIHTSFLQIGTATGRLSSKEPNLQNIPVRSEEGRKIRSAFTAQKGKVFISADYAQIELVVLAHLTGDKNLSQSFIDGTDVHKATAALVYGISPDKVTADQRRFAKTVNFGVMYGMSAFRLANELKISRTEARNFIDSYFKTYAQVKNFISETIDNAQANGFVQTLMGRRRYIPELSSSNKLIQQAAQRIAVNTPIQGSAADIVKTAMINVQAALEKEPTGAKMLLQVHDELIFECPEDSAAVEKTIDIIRREMEGAVKLNVPLRVSIESGKNWGKFH